MNKILLVFPPIWDIFSPYLAIPTLSGFLRQKNIETEIWDANIECYDRMISDDFLETRLQSMEKDISEMNGRSAEYLNLCRKLELGRLLLGQVDIVRQRLRDPEAERSTILQGKNLLENMKWIAGGKYAWPRHEYSINRLCQLEKEIESIERNPFYPLLVRRVEGLDATISLAGISISGISQMVCGFLIARLLKRKNPGIRIVMGGAFLPYIQDTLLRHNRYPEVDFFVIGEGETSLYRLIESVEEQKNPIDVPHLLYAGPDGRYQMTSSQWTEDVNLLPLPDYSALPLGSYFLEPQMMPYLSSRGCYWNRCSFCSQSCNYGSRYRAREIDRVIEDLTEIKRTYHAKYLYFNDESLHPKRILELSRKMIQAGLDFKWLAASRMEEGLTKEHFELAHRAGLRYVAFGMESASQNTLDKMRKGTRVESMARVLKESHEAGIANHIFVITDFPGDLDIRQTVDFVKHNAGYIDSLACSFFCLEKHSYIYDHPEEFDIEISIEPDDKFGLYWPYRHLENGKPREEKPQFAYIEDYKWVIESFSDFPFNFEEFVGYDDRRLFVHIATRGKMALREHNLRSARVRKEVARRFSEAPDNRFKTHPRVSIKKSNRDIFFAYHPDQCHIIYNEVVCALLGEAKEWISFSDSLQKIEERFDVTREVLKKDLLPVLPSLVFLDFITIENLDRNF